MTAESDKYKEAAFLSRPFSLLDDRKSKFFLVLFCGMFSTFFILFYNPFNIQELKYDTALGRLLAIWNAGILGALILSLTQFVLRHLFHLHTFKIGQFILWVIFEFVLICLAVFLIFGESHEPLLIEFSTIIKYTLSLGILPYILACLLIAVYKLSGKSEVNPTLAPHLNSSISIKDENGKIMLVLDPAQILYVKSEDNYVSICYVQHGQVEKKLVRTNLKKLETEMAHPDLIRIHRSYMVNLQSIGSVQRKKGDFRIHLKHVPDTSLKVSDSYKVLFETRIAQ